MLTIPNSRPSRVIGTCLIWCSSMSCRSKAMGWPMSQVTTLLALKTLDDVL
jgi:hypothetical protein